MTIESLRCRNCGASLDEGRIDRALGVVTCAHCGGLHELARARPEAAGAKAPAERADAKPAPERGTAPLPDRFDVHRGDGTLRVRWAKGNKIGAILLAGFAVAWGGGAVSTGLFFLAPVSLVLLYYAAVRGVNRTELRASRGEVDVRRGPLPWRDARLRLARADIAQLVARERISRSHTESRDGRRVKERRSYAVEALDRAGKRRTLLSALSSPAQALWFERELESLLGIDDVAVAGEIR